jgi:hypothetical protein
VTLFTSRDLRVATRRFRVVLFAAKFELVLQRWLAIVVSHIPMYALDCPT